MSSSTDSIYERELRERQTIVDACPIDVYVSSINPRWGYDHKLMSYYEARPSVADSARAVIVDSGYTRIGEMDAILDAGVKVDADLIIPPDVTPGCDGYDPEGDHWMHAGEMEWYYGDYERHDYDGDVLLPIHPPFTEYLDALKRWDPGHVLGYEDDPAFDMRSCRLDLVEKAGGVAVGGLRGLSPAEIIDGLFQVRDRVGYGTHVHALAPGTNMRVLKALRDEPRLVDSLDVSTPEVAPANNKVPDNTWHQHEVPLPRGTDITTLRATRATTIVLQLNFMLSKKCRDDDFKEAYLAAVEDQNPASARHIMLGAFEQAYDQPDTGQSGNI